jgi:hypothetical protein
MMALTLLIQARMGLVSGAPEAGVKFHDRCYRHALWQTPPAGVLPMFIDPSPSIVKTPGLDATLTALPRSTDLSCFHGSGSGILSFTRTWTVSAQHAVQTRILQSSPLPLPPLVLRL